MYFDIDYWWRVVRHVWRLREWSGRNRMLARLLLWIPLRTLFHGGCFLLDYLLFPRLWFQRVEKPVFIIGHARSGTTLMHRLMSADEDRFSYFLYWETFFPSLLQKRCIRGLGWLDAHLLNGFCHGKLRDWDDRTFGPYRHMHNMSLWNAEEDCFAMAAAFVTQQWSLDIPMMDVVDFFHLDHMSHKRQRWMHHYRELVKRQLLLNGSGRTHLAKNPMMSGWVDSLIETFPDARIVVMMRNPEECIPSCLKLVQASWKARGWSADDYEESLDILAGIAYEHFENPRAALARHAQTAHIVVDYRHLTRAPRETVQAVYAALALPLTAQYDQWLAAQAEREKKHHSRFEYSLGEFRLDPAEMRQRLAPFYRDHDWAVPPLPGPEEAANG
jgi:hypothetical protein